MNPEKIIEKARIALEASKLRLIKLSNEEYNALVEHALQEINLYQEKLRVLRIPRCACCDSIENLHEDLGSGGPYRCNSPDCIVF